MSYTILFLTDPDDETSVCYRLRPMSAFTVHQAILFGAAYESFVQQNHSGKAFVVLDEGGETVAREAFRQPSDSNRL